MNKTKKLHEDERRISYYFILRLKPGRDISEVKKSYRNLAVRWLSDRFLETLKKKEAEKKMKLINREESKHIYDFCHQLTDVLPGKKSTMKMYGINAMKMIINTLELQQENMKHLKIQQQILLKIDKSSNSSENDQSYSFDSNEMDSSKIENTSESNDSIFGWKALIIKDNNLFFFFCTQLIKKSFYTYYNKSNYNSYANYCQFSISL